MDRTRESRSKLRDVPASSWTRAEARRYIGLIHDFDCPCEHGHFGCAAWENGPCSNEIAAAHDLIDDRGDW